MRCAALARGARGIAAPAAVSALRTAAPCRAPAGPAAAARARVAGRRRRRVLIIIVRGRNEAVVACGVPHGARGVECHAADAVRLPWFDDVRQLLDAAVSGCPTRFARRKSPERAVGMCEIRSAALPVQCQAPVRAALGRDDR